MGARTLAVRLRELTGYDEEWIAGVDVRANAPATCHLLLAGCIDGGSERDTLAAVRCLSLPERDWLLLELRRRSLGSRIRSEVRCLQCGGSSQIEFSSQDLPMAPPTAPAVQEVLMPSGRRAVLRSLAAGDHECFAAAPGLDSAGQLRLAVAQSLLSVDSVEAAVAEPELDAADLAALGEALSASSPEPVQLESRCDHCGKALSVAFDVCAFFLTNCRHMPRRYWTTFIPWRESTTGVKATSCACLCAGGWDT